MDASYLYAFLPLALAVGWGAGFAWVGWYFMSMMIQRAGYMSDTLGAIQKALSKSSLLACLPFLGAVLAFPPALAFFAIQGSVLKVPNFGFEHLRLSLTWGQLSAVLVACFWLMCFALLFLEVVTLHGFLEVDAGRPLRTFSSFLRAVALLPALLLWSLFAAGSLLLLGLGFVLSSSWLVKRAEEGDSPVKVLELFTFLLVAEMFAETGIFLTIHLMMAAALVDGVGAVESVHRAARFAKAKGWIALVNQVAVSSGEGIVKAATSFLGCFAGFGAAWCIREATGWTGGDLLGGCVFAGAVFGWLLAQAFAETLNASFAAGLYRYFSRGEPIRPLQADAFIVLSASLADPTGLGNKLVRYAEDRAQAEAPSGSAAPPPPTKPSGPTCPRCGSPLTALRCGACGGFWIRQADLEKEVGEPGLLKRTEAEGLRGPSATAIPCPDCGADAKLTRGALGGPLMVVLRCPRCGGLWLDKGELELLRKIFSAPLERTPAG
jgi:Zn-finger nucleic acid-binding protein